MVDASALSVHRLRTNGEDGDGLGRFWQGRYKAVRILDEESLLACAAYIDLNPIRAAFKNVVGTAKSVSEARSLKTHRKFYRARV